MPKISEVTNQMNPVAWLEQELDKYIGPKPHWDRWDYRDWRKRNKE